MRALVRQSPSRVLVLAGLVVLTAACDFHYRAAFAPAEDEVVVQIVPGAPPGYDHPLRISPQELTNVLQEVRVEFKSHWLQRLVTGPLEPLPLFDPSVLARLAPALAEAFEKAGPRDRLVFYVAQRRASDRRDVTSGSIFVRGRLLTITLANHQNRVDVVPGLPAYDRTNPEVAVAPQQFSLVFKRNEYVAERNGGGASVLGADVPTLAVDYVPFLQSLPRADAVPGFFLSPGAPVP